MLAYELCTIYWLINKQIKINVIAEAKTTEVMLIKKTEIENLQLNSLRNRGQEYTD